MFVDSSAIVAILNEEELADALAGRLEASETPFTSPLVLLESSMVLSSRRKILPQEAETRIRNLLSKFSVTIIPIDDQCATIAIDAFTRFGKGRGTKAQLNMSDCLSYAVAKRHNAPILYVGTDFAETDLN